MTTVKQIARSDADLYRVVRLQAMSDAPDLFGVASSAEAQLSEPEWLDRLSRLESDAAAVFLAFDGDVPCGLGEVCIDDSDPRFAVLDPFWIASGRPRRAISDELIDASRAWANTKGAGAVRVVFRPGVEVGLKVHCRVRDRRRGSE